jgi:hypothetical protein
LLAALGIQPLADDERGAGLRVLVDELSGFAHGCFSEC